MPLSGIHSVSIYVNDADQAIDFYTNKLGFTLHDNAPLAYDPSLRWVTVSPPESEMRFVLIKGYADWTPERVGIWTGIVLTVNNMVDTFRQMEANGVEITEQPNSQDWGMQGQFKDQDGNHFLVVGS